MKSSFFDNLILTHSSRSSLIVVRPAGTVGRAGYLKYQDTSTGQLVSEHRTRLGPCGALAVDPQTAVLHAGHANGTVTLWSPSSSKPLVKLLCHRGPLSDLAVDRSGRYLATTGADRTCAIWDVRTYRKLHEYKTGRAPASSCDLSHRGTLALAVGDEVTFYKDACATHQEKPYLRHRLPRDTANGSRGYAHVRFRPYEDVCGIGHGGGFASVVVPGCGEPHFDSSEGADPFRSVRDRREEEVRQLLDKLSPETIALDPDAVGRVEREHGKVEQEEETQEEEGGEAGGEAKKREKNRKRGRNKTAKKLGRKRKNVVDAQTVMLREKLGKERTEREAKEKGGGGEAGAGEADVIVEAPAALRRFFK